MMSNGERIPRLSVGPYHQRPAPILTDNPLVNDFLKIPPPRSPPASTEMRGPPPQWNPPVPPSSTSRSSKQIMDESQYEEPEIPPDSSTQHESAFTGSSATSNRTPLAIGNNYEISTSQQLRSAAASRSRNTRTDAVVINGTPWDDETRQMLVQNPETGSFYVPTGSSHTTMSSLSPHSRHYERTCPTMSAISASAPGPNNRGSRFGSSTVKDASHSNEYEIKKTALDGFANSEMTKKRFAPFCTWRTLAICLFLSLTFTCFIILLLLLGRDGSKHVYVHSSRSIFSSAVSPNSRYEGKIIEATPETTVLLSVPESFELGEQIEGELPPGVLIYTRFSLQRDSRIAFNISVGPRAQIVIYGRQTVLPSPAVHDFMDIVRADRLHVGTVDISNRKKRSTPPTLLRSAILAHYLVAGRWHLAFLNDGPQPQFIRLSAGVAAQEVITDDERSDDCRFGCGGRGECKDGKCHCFPGFNGPYCEENSCPVLCSGNGLFSGGRCVCHEGYKGVDCDLLSHWCEVPNCNGHGVCNQNGVCDCDRGWNGDSCSQKDCDDPTCTGHGFCHNATCYCENGYRGESCEEQFNFKSLCAVYMMEQQVELENSQGTKTVRVEKSQDSEPLCSSRGRIDSKTGICRCLPGYHGEKCQLARCDVECLHGSCGDGKCSCDAGWAGLDCGERQCIVGCEEHGLCKNGTCICQKGWNGENCHIPGCDNNCNGNGVCQLFSDIWKCACDGTHFGSDCSLPIESDCDDGIDNDNDGLIDCEDSECCTFRSCSSSQMCTTVVQPRDILLKVLPSVNANFYQQIKFLAQPDSVQRYADDRQFNESYVSVIRGRVISENGSPLTGVRVAEARHPPLTGFTLSRSEDGGGAFDIMVNGGRVVSLQFMRKPFEKLEKSFYVPWNEIVYVGDIRMHMGTMPTSASGKEDIEENCRIFHASHRISPFLFPFWLTNQHSGKVLHSLHSSQILVDSRTSFDSVQVPGTSDIFLVYDSSRADKYRSNLLIQMLPETVPELLRLVHLKINIVGNHFENIFSAVPNLTYTFSWDQTNVYAQTVNGLVNAYVSVGYEYVGCSGHNVVWVHRTVKLEGRKAKRFNLGMWTLNIHHHYDVVNNVVEKGDATKIYLDELPKVLVTAVGNDQQRPINCPFCNEPVSSARLFRPEALCTGSDGSLYIGDYNLIRRMNPNGSLVTLLELSISDTAHPYYMALDPRTDSLHISLPLRRQIWQINKEVNGDLSGNYNVVVGDGSICSDTSAKCGDDGPAELAQLTFPKGIAFDFRGNLFVADSRRIRMISKERQIVTIIPSHPYGPRSCSTEIDDLSKMKLEWPTSLSVDESSGNLIVLDSDIIYRISLKSKTANLVTGSVPDCERLTSISGEVVPLRHLSDAKAIAVGPDSIVYIVESNGKRLNQIRALFTDGRSRIIAGKASKCDCDRTNCPCESEGPTVGSSAFLHSPSAIAVDPSGLVYIADQGNFKVKKLINVYATYDSNVRQYRVHSPHTNEVYIFNRNGLHVNTKSLLSGLDMYNFSYNVDTNLGRLTQITGAGGHSLMLRRMNDTETILESSTGLRTTLSFDGFGGNLESITSPIIGEKIKFSYLPGQFLYSKMVGSRVWFYEYDDFGRVNAIINPSGVRTYIGEQRLENGKLFTSVMLNENLYSTFTFAPSEFSESGVEDRHAIVLDDGLLIDAQGYRTHFDSVVHPLLDAHETAMLKRKITLASNLDPPRRELNMRFEWRGYVRRKEFTRRSNTSESGRRVLQVNGRNVFSIEFDREKKTDTIRNSGDEEVLRLDYNEAGQIVNISPRERSRLAALNAIYDSQGRHKKLSWGNSSIDFGYDRQSRVTQFAMGYAANLLIRKYGYQKETQYTPSTVQMPSGEKYRWRYDRMGAVSSLKTPSGEAHHFTQFASLHHIIFHRRPPFASAPFLTSSDDEGNLMEYSTPDAAHSLTVKRDIFARTIQISADGDNVFMRYPEFNGGTKPVEVSCDLLRRKFIYQGPLTIVAEEFYPALSFSNRRFAENVAHFSYDYDDLFRLTTVTASFDNTPLDAVRFEYDSRDGRLTKIQNFAFLRDGPVRRILGNKIVVESVESAESEEITRKVLMGETRVAEVIISHDSLGRVESVEWTILGEKRPVERRTFNVDGQLAQFTVGERDDRRWTLHYDLDGRLKGVNEAKLHLETGGVPKSFEQLVYTVDENGWVAKRGDAVFELDVFGRLKHVQLRSVDVEYGYDEQSRVIWRRVGDQLLHRFFYAFPHRPRLISHFLLAGDSSVSSIIYNEQDVPISLHYAGFYYAVVTDPEHSVRFIFGSDATLVKEIVRNPLGTTVLDTNPSFFFPLGYLSEFDDPLTGIVIIGPDARPMDSLIGRFISTPLSYASSPLDVFRPELEADPFRLTLNTANTPRKIPFDVSVWMEMVGFSLSHIVPSLGNPSSSTPNFDSLSSLCELSLAHAVTASFCSLAGKIVHFSQFLTVTTSGILPSSQFPFRLISDKVQYSAAESIGFKGIVFAWNATSKVTSLTPFTENLSSVSAALNSLLENGTVVEDGDMGICPLSDSTIEAHIALPAVSVSEAATKDLDSVFNISARGTEIILSADNSAIFFHFGTDADRVRAELIRRRNTEMEKRVWAYEATLARRGGKTRHSWTDAEIKELSTKGIVSNYNVIFHPGKSLPILSNNNLWIFDKTRS